MLIFPRFSRFPLRLWLASHFLISLLLLVFSNLWGLWWSLWKCFSHWKSFCSVGWGSCICSLSCVGSFCLQILQKCWPISFEKFQPLGEVWCLPLESIVPCWHCGRCDYTTSPCIPGSACKTCIPISNKAQRRSVSIRWQSSSLWRSQWRACVLLWTRRQSFWFGFCHGSDIEPHTWWRGGICWWRCLGDLRSGFQWDLQELPCVVRSRQQQSRWRPWVPRKKSIEVCSICHRKMILS